MKQRVLIIGGGLGGLFSGAILAKEGLEVTVLEKNKIIGGGLQSFRMWGEDFDTGMHIIGGMRPGGNIYRLCSYLGIIDQVCVRDVDHDCTDRLYFAEDQRYYTIAEGKDTFVETLSRQFPHEHDGLKAYVEALFRLSEEVDLFYLRPSKDLIPMHSAQFNMSAEAFIAQYINDKKLRSVLAYMNPLYGGRAQQTPAYVHAIISVLYINGPSRFVGGSLRFAHLLAETIQRHGGKVLGATEVTHIGVTDRQVTCVETADGQHFEAEYYISAIHPCALLKVIDSDAFTKAYRTRLKTIPNSYSAFSLYVKLKPNSFPYINHSEYFMARYADIWQFGRDDKPWPLGFLFMTPPNEGQGAFASKVLVTAPMAFSQVEAWEQTTIGHRTADYRQWKEQQCNQLLAMVEVLHPGFSTCIETVNTASPLTIRDFYGAKEGGICGYSKDCNNLALSQLPVVTKVSNLFLTGQNNNLHGFCGVPLTAIQTCEAILGRNYVLNQLNHETANSTLSVPRDDARLG